MNNKCLFLLAILLLLSSCSDFSPAKTAGHRDRDFGGGHNDGNQRDDERSRTTPLVEVDGDDAGSKGNASSKGGFKSIKDSGGVAGDKAIRAVSGIANIGNTCWANAAHQFLLVNPCMDEMATHQLVGHQDIVGRKLVQSKFKSLMGELKAGKSSDDHERRSRELLDAVSKLDGFQGLSDTGPAKIGNQLDSNLYLKFLLKSLEYERTSCSTSIIRLRKSDHSATSKPTKISSKVIDHNDDIAKEDDIFNDHPKTYRKFSELAKSLLIQFLYSSPGACASSLTLSIYKADDKELHLKSAIIHRPGHYYSLVRHKDEWFRLNDRSAIKITLATAMSEIRTASMVMYVEREFL